MYIAFDTETSGLTQDHNLLTAYFQILNENLEMINDIYLQVKYDNYCITPIALSINKIDIIEHDNKANTIQECQKKLVDFIEKTTKEMYYSKRLVPIGHNIEFDINFIKGSGLLPGDLYSKYISANAIDTITISQFLKLCKAIPKTQRLGLQYITHSLGIQSKSGFHHAKSDVEVTVSLLKKYKQMATLNL